MDQKSPWYRWPEDKRIGQVPWFVVVRRVAFFPLVLAGKVLIFLGTCGGWSVDEAIRDWRSI